MEEIAEPTQDVQNPVNVYTPEGDLVSIPSKQLGEALDMGYQNATAEDVHDYKIQQKYGSPIEQAKTFGESALKNATFGLSTGVERALGVKPEDIRGREEANPVAATTGSIAGLAGSALIPGVGEAKLLGQAGEAAARMVPGLTEGAGALAKVGSAAVKGAAEFSLLGAQDEVSKMFAGDPNQTAGTAIADIGLSGLLGAGTMGALGAVSPLWKETVGNKLGTFLDLVKKRANGEAITIAPELESAIKRTGMEVAPEIRAAISENPTLQNYYQTLVESQTEPGLAVKKTTEEFRKNANKSLVEALGKTPEEISGLGDISAHEVGSEIQKSLAKSIDDRIKPLTDKFEAIKNEFSGIAVDDSVKGKLAEDLAGIAQKEGYGISASSPQNKIIQQTLNDIGNVKTVEDLRKLRSIIGQNTYDVLNTKGLNQVGKQIGKVFNNIEEQLVENAAGMKNPHLLEQVKGARSQYKSAMNLLDELNDRLHVGNYGGGGSFVNSLKEMNPEKILSRLSPKNDAGMLDLLKKEFPEIYSSVKDYQLNKLLGSAALKAGDDQVINSKALFNSINKLSPEMRSFILPEGASDKIEGIKALLEALPKRTNPSGTAGTVAKLFSKMPSSGLAMVSMLAGHNPVAGFLFGKTAEWLQRDAPDAMRLAFLKFLGHSGPVDPHAFKSLVDYAAASIKGETALTKGAGAIFKSGAQNILRKEVPSEKEKQKLDRHIKEMQADPSLLMNVGGKTSYYAPEHATPIAANAGRAVNYLGSIRPEPKKLGVLDKELPPSAESVIKYSRALDIAERPLSLFSDIKDGTLTHDQVIHLKSMYPELYSRMSEKLTSEMTNTVTKDNPIPYKTRLGLSLFLGQGLDSTLTSQSIQMNQGTMTGQAQQQQSQQAPQGSRLHKVAALEKLPGSFNTPEQASAEKRRTRS